MTKTFNDARCTLCGRRISKNGLATSAHAKAHVRAGDATSAGAGRYAPTAQGWAKSRATDTALKELLDIGVAAGHILNKTHYTSPEFSSAYDAYNSALNNYMEYANK